MCESLVEISVQSVIVVLTCVAHSTSLWLYTPAPPPNQPNTPSTSTVHGGMWEWCPPPQQLPPEYATIGKLCDPYNETIAHKFSHKFYCVLVSRGFLLATNIVAALLLLLLGVNAGIATPNCTALAPAIFQLCFVTIALATMTYAFITSSRFDDDDDVNDDVSDDVRDDVSGRGVNEMGGSFIAVWCSLPLCVIQLILVSTVFCPFWNNCPVKNPKRTKRAKHPQDPPKIEEDTTSMEEKRAAKIEVRDDSRTQRSVTASEQTTADIVLNVDVISDGPSRTKSAYNSHHSHSITSKDTVNSKPPDARNNSSANPPTNETIHT